MHDVTDKASAGDCPAGCICEGERMHFIHSGKRAGCACEPVCPAEAISCQDDVPSQQAPRSWRSRGCSPRPASGSPRRTAQLVFERVMFERGQQQAATGGILDATGQTRRTLTPDLVAESEQDITGYARMSAPARSALRLDPADRRDPR